MTNTAHTDDRLILASQSPRRKEILHRFLSDFSVIPSHAEEVFDESLPLDEALMKVAMAKAEEVSAAHPGRPVLAADTIVCDGDRILGKPKDRQEAFETLRSLSGRKHEVKTGVVLLYPDAQGLQTLKTVETTGVLFRPLTDQEIEAYVRTGTCLDKAGSYGIQDVDFASALEGSYTNVVGLPEEVLEKWLPICGLISKTER